MRIRITLVVVALVSLACGREGPIASQLAAPFETATPGATAAPAATSTPRPAPTTAPVRTTAPASTAPAAPPAPAALSEAKLQTALLTVDELPPGWKKAQPGDGGGTGGPEFEMCGQDNEQKHPAAAVADADFENEGAVQFLSLSTESYRSVASVAASFEEARDQVRRCPTWTETDDDRTEYTFHITEMAMPKIADETLGWEIHMDITGPNGEKAEAKGYAMGARIGQSAVGHFHMALGFMGAPRIERSDSEAILRRAVEKFQRVV